METNKKSPFFNNYKFNCINCDYYSNKISDYDKHLTTAKHKRRLLANEKVASRMMLINIRIFIY